MRTVLHDPTERNPAKAWKMWYSATDGARKGRLAYATSADGFSWKKFGVVLDLGVAGQFDDNILQGSSGAVIQKDGTYYLFYSGDRSVNGRTQWGGGLATFTDPEGPYTRQGQILTALMDRVGDLTAYTLRDSPAVTPGREAQR